MEDFQNHLPKKYKKDFTYSYALGPFPTFELLQSRPDLALAVFIDETFHEKEKLEQRCQNSSIPFYYSQKALARIADKEICYAAGIFKKYNTTLDKGASHVVLVNPSNMGNIGTILRTVLGFGIKNLAVIEPCADFFSPKVIRASMGALFRLNFSHFPSFEAYYRLYQDSHDIFPFMLDGGCVLTPQTCPKSECFSLVFGNEATGLPDDFHKYGKSVFIDQSNEVDSLNLGISVGIGTYLFTQANKR